jgi:hypothetical protein
MNTIALNGDQVTIAITGWDKVFSLKGEVTFPKTSITNVYAFDNSLSPPWLRNPGTAIPGIITAGTYQNLGDRKEFWCTHFKGNALVIDLDHEDYSRIVVDLADHESVEAWVATLAP